jgi:hypothetical protein
MSILVHKVGINKTLGQKSDYLEGGSTIPRTDTTGWRNSLTGEWEAFQGFSGAGDIWDNQIAGGNDLRAFNSMAVNSSSSPHHLVFDGVDDYIWNTSTGYGGNPFTVDLSADFTIGQWVRCNTGTAFTVCVQTSGSTGSLYTTINSLQWSVFGNGGSATTSAIAGYSMKANTWHFLSMSHDRSEGYVNIYLDGKFADAFNPTYTSGNWTGARNLGFGHAIVQNSGNINANTSLECAFLWVWNKYWGASHHRHMFLGQYGGNGINSSLPYFGAPRTA